MKQDEWIEERHENFFAQRYKVKRQLFCGQSKFQKVEIVETEQHGRMLLNDDLVMVSERDEFVYHDMIAHVPLFVHPDPKRVLVIGGGDGGTVREVLRHPSVRQCVMVEIDSMVVNACREHLNVCSGQLNHPKLELLISDGVEFVAQTDQTFDVALIDSTDPIGPATPLFGTDFYRNLHERLSDDGIVVSQGESPWYEVKMQNTLLEIKRELFNIVTCYNYNNLTYPGGLWSFTWASKKYHPLKDFAPSRTSGLTCRYYNADIHRAAFALPQFQLDAMGSLRKEMV